MDAQLTELLARVPGWEGRAEALGYLEGGITNRNVLVGVGDERFVLRLAGKDTELLEIRRNVEHIAASRAAALGVAPEVVAFLEPEGYLVTRFVTGERVPMAAMREPPVLREVARILRSFHESGPLDGTFDAFRVPELHRAAAESRGVTIPQAYAAARGRAAEIEAAFAVHPDPRCPCHDDLLTANFLRDATGRIWLLDWEYAGMNDRYFDLGNFSVNNELDEGSERELLAAYFGSVTPRRQARLALMKIMSDFREAMWGVVQQGISTLDFDYVDYATTHFDRLLDNAGRPGYESLLADATRPEEAAHDA